jgi:hypothetical protein
MQQIPRDVINIIVEYAAPQRIILLTNNAPVVALIAPQHTHTCSNSSGSAATVPYVHGRQMMSVIDDDAPRRPLIPLDYHGTVGTIGEYIYHVTVLHGTGSRTESKPQRTMRYHINNGTVAQVASMIEPISGRVGVSCVFNDRFYVGGMRVCNCSLHSSNLALCMHSFNCK